MGNMLLQFFIFTHIFLGALIALSVLIIIKLKQRYDKRSERNDRMVDIMLERIEDLQFQMEYSTSERQRFLDQAVDKIMIVAETANLIGGDKLMRSDIWKEALKQLFELSNDEYVKIVPEVNSDKKGTSSEQLIEQFLREQKSSRPTLSINLNLVMKKDLPDSIKIILHQILGVFIILSFDHRLYHLDIVEDVGMIQILYRGRLNLKSVEGELMVKTLKKKLHRYDPELEMEISKVSGISLKMNTNTLEVAN